MTNNTTRQSIYKKVNAIVAGGAVQGPAATLQDHFETMGTFVANGTTQVVITEPMVTANSSIVITLKTVGGTVSPSVPYIDTITAGTGFTTKATASDTSTYNYVVMY